MSAAAITLHRQPELGILGHVLAAILIFGTSIGNCSEPVYHPNTTRKMYQLVGDLDRPLQSPTASLTNQQAKLSATDLGSSFEHKGILYFLFGDTKGRSTAAVDSFATSTAVSADNLVLNIPLAPDGKFLVVTVPGIEQQGMEVPCGGISVNGKVYIVCTTDWYATSGNMERSVLARSDDDGYTWSVVYDLSAAVSHDMTNARFINVSMAEIQAEDYPGMLPWSTGAVTLIWGSGAYRASNVCLSAIPSAQIENKSAMRYYAGTVSGTPTWSTLESDAAYLFNQPQVGEFSVAWISQVERWVMLYNAASPRGITMRTASSPWGPWSAGSVIMEPWSSGAYGIFMHVPWAWAHVDDFQDGGGTETWGGEYGPYLIPRFATGDSSRCQLYYTMSTWNPYTIVMMRSEIGTPVSAESSLTTSDQTVPGDADWQMSSPDFYQELTRNDVPCIETYTTATGWMWRWLPRDTLNKKLQFKVYGGRCEVMVLSGGGDIPVSGVTASNLYTRIKNGEFGEVVLCTWGHDSNDIDVTLDWDLRPFDRANLKVVVFDNRTLATWGYVGVSRMTLVRIANQSTVSDWALY